MSVSDFGAVAIVIPNPEYDNSNGARVVTDAYGFSLRASGAIRTLSANNPQRWNVIQGLLYYPELPEDTPCTNETQSIAPANVTTRAQIPLGNYPLIAVAPWTDPSCVQSYLEVMRFDNARGGIFFHPDNRSNRPPPSNDDSWSLNDGGQWKTDNQFPVYALPGSLGVYLLEQLGQYSGNMSTAPFGDELVQLYNPNDTVRLYTRMDISQSSGAPSLWVFLIIVLAILLAVVLTTSIMMHCVQRRQRRALQRRVANGDVDLEALGIKRLNVPQDLLDKMPQYMFTSKAEGMTDAPAAAPKAEKPETNETASRVSSTPREVQFTQSTCPICLDDFVHGETTVRELPCNHIFHPECIDPFLRDNSSLCPMCKKSALPPGYCPVVVTNLMVRRERLVRRRRERRLAQAIPPESNPSTGPSPMDVIRNTVRRMSTAPTRPPPHASASGAHGEVTELQPVTGRRLTQVQEDEMPEEVRSQGISARRAWRRERLARQQAQTYDQQANEARQADVSRPLWRRIVGRVIPRYE